MTVSVDVLGPLCLRVGDDERSLRGRRERLLLALLATTPGRHVGDDRLVDELWGDDPPAGATSALQVAVSRLRRALGDAGEVRRDSAGYALVGAEVDAVRLLAAAERVGRLDPGQVVAETSEVLALWRGTPYAGLGGAPTLAVEATRLEETRLALLEARAQALLDLGRAQDAHLALAPEVAAHPFRERLWTLLALALYRSDRQADALEALRTLRAALVDELGVDPSASVRSLEEQVLAQDPRLGAPAAPRSSPAPVVADATRARVSGVVGRAAALSAIHAALAELTGGGRGGVLLISGDAGIGKSMLATELGHRAQDHGARVHVGRCHEADLAPPYWPWLPVLRRLVAESPSVPVEVTDLLEGHAADPGAEAAGVGAAAATTMRTFAAVVRLLASQPGPMVVLVEDLHWADQTSLRLLAYAAEELRDRPVLLVGTVRTVDPRHHPHLAHALAGLARLAARRVPVPPLDEAAVAELLAEVVPDPDPDLVEVLTRRSDGNPFFVLEMARLLVAGGRATPDAARHLDVPDGIADVLRLRVLRLPEATRAALGVASVVGRSFDTRQLASALGAGVLEALDPAVAAGVVEEAEEPGGFRFVHALTRETVYADLPLARRAHWHAVVGRWLADRLAVDPELLGEVAHHFAVAAPYLPEVAEDAVDHGRRAAVAAERRGAFEEARDLWVRTLEVERGLVPADPRRRHDLLLALATARQRLGDMDGMGEALHEAIERARAVGDHVRMAQAATSFRSSGVWHWREMGDTDERAIAVLQECLEHVEDVGLRARVLATLGLEHYVGLDPDQGDTFGRESIELARASGDPDVLRDCLNSRAIALWAPGRARERMAMAEESMTLAMAPEYEISTRFQLATGLHHVGRAQEADEVMAGAYAITARLRHTGSDVPLGWWRWLRAVELEDPDASRIGRDALAVHRRTSMVGLPELSGLYTLQCQPPGAPVPADVVATATGHPFASFRAAVAHAVCLAGDVDGALRLLAAPDRLGSDYAGVFAGCRTVEVLAMAGHPALADAVATLQPFTDRVATYGSVVSLGSTAHFVGVGLAALGRTAEARSHLEVALADNTAAGSTRWMHTTREALASLPTS